MKKILASLLVLVGLLGVHAQAAQVPLSGVPNGYSLGVLADQNFTQLFGGLNPLPAPYVGNVTTGTAVSDGLNTSSTTIMERVPLIATDTLTQPAAVMGCWYAVAAATGEEKTTGSACTENLSIEYPAGTCTHLTWGGTTPVFSAYGVTLYTGGAAAPYAIPDFTNAVTDATPLKVPVPKGALYWLRVRLANTVGIPNKGQGTNIYNGAAIQFSSNAPDQTDSCDSVTLTGAGTVYPGGGGMYYPLAIVQATQQQSMALTDDSRGAGVGHGFIGFSVDRGHMAMPLGKLGIGYTNLSLQGDRPDWYAQSHALREQIVQYNSIRSIGLGINEATAGATAAQINADTDTIRSYNPTQIRATVLQTMEPTSTSTDNWVTPTPAAATNNQTPAAANAARLAVNAYRLGVPAGYKATVDLAAPVSAGGATASAYWEGRFGQITADGTHLNFTGAPLSRDAVASTLPRLLNYLLQRDLDPRGHANDNQPAFLQEVG